MNNKDNIIYNLNILNEYELIHNNIYKSNAYKRVINNLKEIDYDINNINDLKNIKGIGKSIKNKIIEIINTGKLSIVDNIILNDNKYILSKKLLNIYGIGPINIKKIINKIDNFDELKLEKNNKLLNNKQKIGLKYYDDLLLKIEYNEILKHKKIIKNELNNTKFEIVGSFRRKKKLIGDIDILILNNPTFDFKLFINNLKSKGYIIDILASGKNKFMGICKLNKKLPARRIDILLCDNSNYYFSLLYFTGSYEFNIYIRNIALKNGYSLNEYGFKDIKTNKLIDTKDIIKNERDIFKFLKIKYIKPSLRF